MEIMNYDHLQWEEFLCKLEGEEGCDFKEKEPENTRSTTWKCNNKKERPFARKIMESMGDIDIDKSMEFFDKHGGYCDCEILFNVAK